MSLLPKFPWDQLNVIRVFVVEFTLPAKEPNATVCLNWRHLDLPKPPMTLSLDRSRLCFWRINRRLVSLEALQPIRDNWK